MSDHMIDNFEEENKEEDSILINPEEVRNLNRRRMVDENKEEQEAIEKAKETLGKIHNRGGQVAINYETMGRFDIPQILYFKDFTIQDINDLTLSRQDDILETLVSILNKAKNEDANVNIEDMLVDEMFETLVGIKQEFNSPYHVHPWVCECQNDLPEEAQKVNETQIDLRTLKYKSVEDVDNEIREYIKQQLEQMSGEEFLLYMRKKYKNNENYEKNPESIEKEIKNVKVKEPIVIFDENGNQYSFRFLRIKDILNAQKISEAKYAGKIKAVKNKQYANAKLVDAKAKKEKEVEKLKYDQAKDTVLFARAFTLIEYNGEKLDHEKAISYYKNAPSTIFRQVSQFIDKLQFGVVDERELTCPECGQVSRRLLRQDINPLELLPIDIDSEGKQRESSKFNIYFGV